MTTNGMTGSRAALLSLVLGACALLGGCGRPPADGAGPDRVAQGDEAALPPGVPVAMQGRWLATAACSVIDRDDIAIAMGSWVRTTEVSDVIYPLRRRAAASSCHYSLANGSAVDLTIREAPRAIGVDRTIAELRATDDEAAPRELLGLGKAAFWSAGEETLEFFLDDRRSATITLMDARPDRDPEAMATAIARKIG